MPKNPLIWMIAGRARSSTCRAALDAAVGGGTGSGAGVSAPTEDDTALHNANTTNALTARPADIASTVLCLRSRIVKSLAFEPAVTGYIGGEYRRQPALHLCRRRRNGPGLAIAISRFPVPARVQRRAARQCARRSHQ